MLDSSDEGALFCGSGGYGWGSCKPGMSEWRRQRRAEEG